MSDAFTTSASVLPRNHIMQIYGNDNQFIELLAGYVTEGFEKKESVVVIATAEHVLSLNRKLSQTGYDIDSAMRCHQYITIDAQALLDQFMVDNWPSKELFLTAIVPILERAAGADHQITRAFGEMVVLLWKNGFYAATIQLEQYWNELAEQYDFMLLCAYPATAFTQGLQSAAQHICNAHSASSILESR